MLKTSQNWTKPIIGFNAWGSITLFHMLSTSLPALAGWLEKFRCKAC